MPLFRLAFLVLLFALPLGARADLLGFDRLEQALRLSAQQKEQFEAAVGSTKRAVFGIGLGALQMKQRLASELLKDRPDPRALAEAQEALVEHSRPLVLAAREEWLRLYAMMDDEQVAIARAFVEEKLRKLERAGEYLGRYLADHVGPER